MIIAESQPALKLSFNRLDKDLDRPGPELTIFNGVIILFFCQNKPTLIGVIEACHPKRRKGPRRECCVCVRECCLLVLNSVTSTPCVFVCVPSIYVRENLYLHFLNFVCVCVQQDDDVFVFYLFSQNQKIGANSMYL